MKCAHRTRFAFVLAVSAAVCLLAPRARTSAAVCGTSCGTTIAGGLQTGIWSAAGSPYCIEADVTLAGLTITEGVCVRIAPGVTLDVANQVSVTGTAERPVVFTAANQSPLQRWGTIRIQSVSNTLLRHCRIEFASASGVRVIDASPVLEHCTIQDNSSAGHGAGIYASLGGTNHLVVRDCLIRRNRPLDGYWGGGAYVSGDVTFARTTIEDNVCYEAANIFNTGDVLGGGLFVAGGDVTLEGCVVRGNSVTSNGCCNPMQARGGGTASIGGNLVLANTIVGCNTASGASLTQGSGIWVGGGTVAVENCTIARNGPHGVYGPAVVRNSIVYFNAAPQVVGATLTFSDVEGGAPGAGNINANPTFLGTSCEPTEMRIFSVSPCVDQGDPTSAPETCFPPSWGTNAVDMGAHGGAGACVWGASSRGGRWENYCLANPNSTGAPAHLWASGSASLSGPGLVLEVVQCPPNTPGIFFFGGAPAQIAFGNGYRCIAAPITRMPPPAYTDGAGVATYAVQTSALVFGTLSVGPGDVRRFQYWYRNPAGGGPGFNLTEGLTVWFSP